MFVEFSLKPVHPTMVRVKLMVFRVLENAFASQKLNLDNFNHALPTGNRSFP